MLDCNTTSAPTAAAAADSLTPAFITSSSCVVVESVVSSSPCVAAASASESAPVVAAAAAAANHHAHTLQHIKLENDSSQALIKPQLPPLLPDSSHVPDRLIEVPSSPSPCAIEIDAASTPLNDGAASSESPSVNPLKARRVRRTLSQLLPFERWQCPRACGKQYRKNSTVSIRTHLQYCVGAPSLSLSSGGASLPSPVALCAAHFNVHHAAAPHSYAFAHANHAINQSARVSVSPGGAFAPPLNVCSTLLVPAPLGACGSSGVSVSGTSTHTLSADHTQTSHNHQAKEDAHMQTHALALPNTLSASNAHCNTHSQSSCSSTPTLHPAHLCLELIRKHTAFKSNTHTATSSPSYSSSSTPQGSATPKSFSSFRSYGKCVSFAGGPVGVCDGDVPPLDTIKHVDINTPSTASTNNSTHTSPTFVPINATVIQQNEVDNTNSKKRSFTTMNEVVQSPSPSFSNNVSTYYSSSVYYYPPGSRMTVSPSGGYPSHPTPFVGSPSSQSLSPYAYSYQPHSQQQQAHSHAQQLYYSTPYYPYAGALSGNIAHNSIRPYAHSAAYS